MRRVQNCIITLFGHLVQCAWCFLCDSTVKIKLNYVRSSRLFAHWQCLCSFHVWAGYFVLALQKKYFLNCWIYVSWQWQLSPSTEWVTSSNSFSGFGCNEQFLYVLWTRIKISGSKTLQTRIRISESISYIDTHSMKLNGSVSRDFQHLFWAWFEIIWAPDKQAEIFSNSVSISPRYSILKFENSDSVEWMTLRSQYSPMKALNTNKKFFTR